MGRQAQARRGGGRGGAGCVWWGHISCLYLKCILYHTSCCTKKKKTKPRCLREVKRVNGLLLWCSLKTMTTATCAVSRRRFLSRKSASSIQVRRKLNIIHNFPVSVWLTQEVSVEISKQLLGCFFFCFVLFFSSAQNFSPNSSCQFPPAGALGPVIQQLQTREGEG